MGNPPSAKGVGREVGQPPAGVGEPLDGEHDAGIGREGDAPGPPAARRLSIPQLLEQARLEKTHTRNETLERGSSHRVASSDRVVAPWDLNASSKALYSPWGALASFGRSGTRARRCG